MSNNTFTFYSFIKEHKIQIPLIQRDYVQGLALDNKSKEKRDDFVAKLLNALLPDKTSYNLDFIYGAKENFGTDLPQVTESPFLPLDGQQRLTTLYLLHWCLLQLSQTEKNSTEEEKNVFTNRIKILSKFSYKTRISSRRFCQKLTDNTFKPESLVKQIKNKYWFDNDMESDPTVQAMIEMLQQIETMLEEEKYKNYLSDMTDNLFLHERITFNLLNMDSYNLTDGLYVKMNARGKELTTFENWKAEFIALISDNSEDKKRFTRGIEHEWNDVFWPIAYNRYYNESKKDNHEDIEYPRIDESFMNFFDNFCRLYYFITSDKKNLNAEDFKKGLSSTNKEVFEKQNVRNNFFTMLDTLSEIKKTTGVDIFFNDIFYTDESTDWQFHTSKVKLFGGNINLFDSACSSCEFEWSHVMLYAILSYCSKFKLYQVDDDLRNYVRVCRNYLDEHNYFSSSNVTIISQVRANDMKTYDSFFNMLQDNKEAFKSLISPSQTNEYIKTEQEKLIFYQDHNTLKLVRKIEDMSYTHGYIKAFSTWLVQCIGNPTLCEKTWKAIYAFYKASPLDKVRLFCIYRYQGIFVKNCAHGKAVFMGGEFEKTPRWMVHFRQKIQKNSKHPLDDWFCKYMTEYKEQGSLDKIISNKTGSAICSPSTVWDYMLKYPDILASQVYWRNDQNSAPFYFAMQNPWNDLDIITIHSFSKAPLNRAYQTCPMANAVAIKINNFKKYSDDNANPKRISSVGEGASKAGIVINKDGDWNHVLFILWFNKFEWMTNSSCYNHLSPNLQAKFSHGTNADDYILDTTDLIADAIEFMNSVVTEFEKNGLL